MNENKEYLINLSIYLVSVYTENETRGNDSSTKVTQLSCYNNTFPKNTLILIFERILVQLSNSALL